MQLLPWIVFDVPLPYTVVSCINCVVCSIINIICCKSFFGPLGAQDNTVLTLQHRARCSNVLGVIATQPASPLQNRCVRVLCTKCDRFTLHIYTQYGRDRPLPSYRPATKSATVPVKKRLASTQYSTRCQVETSDFKLQTDGIPIQ